MGGMTDTPTEKLIIADVGLVLTESGSNKW